MDRPVLAVFLVYLVIAFHSGHCFPSQSEPEAEIHHLRHEVELNQNRILSMGETYGKEFSKMTENFSKMTDRLEESLSQLSGANMKILTMSSDVASLKEALTQYNSTASDILKKVEKEMMNIKDSQQSAVLSLTEQLSDVRNSMSEMKRNTSDALTKLQSPTDIAHLIERNPIVSDMSERLKSLESSLLMDPPLKDVVHRTGAGLTMLQSTLLPAFRQLRMQMVEVQKLVRNNAGD